MSKIEWTGETWNPIVGCSIVSPGCTNCYAMKMALAPEHIITKPLRWSKPRTVFVNSMSDLFHEDVPDAWIDKVFAVIGDTPQHTYQVLTKRSARMRQYLSHPQRSRYIAHEAAKLDDRGSFAAAATWDRIEALCRKPLPNVWLGVSAERQQEACERIPDLIMTPAAVRFVSAEPLLGPIDFGRFFWQPDLPNARRDDRLHWVIVGGESGPGARPMHPDWARGIRDQCQEAEVPFFFKQWGTWAPCFGQMDVERAAVSVHDGTTFTVAAHERPRMFSMLDRATMKRVGKAKAGRLLDGREWNEMPGTQAGEVAA